MGRNNKKSKAKNNNTNKQTITQNVETNELPFVSVCTPTYNRRPFIEGMIKCFDHQDYPKDKMEWIIIDDGTDKIEELVVNHPNVKYFKYDEKITLGKKRNLLHEKSKGDILVYMDDDDYYPPERVSHAVEKLTSNKEALCAGSSEIYIYFKHINQMFKFGPYGEKHATAGTFAFKRELIKNKYDEEACLAEEKSFLKNYTVPFVQLDPMKVILVFSHNHNTFDKKKLLDNQHPQYCKPSTKTVDDFVKQSDLKEYFMNIDSLLTYYTPGLPRMKPDVLEQIIKIEEFRRKHAEKVAASSGAGGQIMVQQGDQNIALNNQQIVDIMKKQQDQLHHQNGQLNTIKQAFEKLSRENMVLKENISKKDKIISELQENITKILTKQCSD
jgi:glycosyltransferase involved in cell wall biosynthesis